MEQSTCNPTIREVTINSPAPHPYSDYLRRKGDSFVHTKRELTAADLRHRGLDGPLVTQLESNVRTLVPALTALSEAIHADPELGLAETRTVRRIATALDRHGVDVEIGSFGLPTSFHAVIGRGEPRVAVLAEYDALPEVGHGCGHNVIAAAAVGAFLSLRGIVERTGGSVELIGTPAEENAGGKELILQAGGFDGLAAAVMVHPAGRDVASWSSYSGRRALVATFTGQSAHAAANPFLGRNALDAALLAQHGIALLRQHMLPTDRLHFIVTDGGAVANVIPDHAELGGSVRSLDLDTLAVLSSRVEDIMRGAAIATGTEVELSWDATPPYLPMRPSHLLGARYVNALSGRRDVWWHVDSGEASGSTDMGNISHWVPAIHPTIAIAPPTASSHSHEMAQHAISARAQEGIKDGALALARVLGDMLADEELRADVAAEFEAAGGRQRADQVLPGYSGTSLDEVQQVTGSNS